MRFQLGGLSKTTHTTSAATSLALLPLSIVSSITAGSQGSAFSITLTSRTPSSRPLENIRVRLPLGKGANGVNATVSGGGFARDAGGQVKGDGAGRWDVQSVAGEGQVLEWTIAQLVSTDRPAVLAGQYYT